MEPRIATQTHLVLAGVAHRLDLLNRHVGLTEHDAVLAHVPGVVRCNRQYPGPRLDVAHVVVAPLRHLNVPLRGRATAPADRYDRPVLADALGGVNADRVVVARLRPQPDEELAHVGLVFKEFLVVEILERLLPEQRHELPLERLALSVVALDRDPRKRIVHVLGIRLVALLDRLPDDAVDRVFRLSIRPCLGDDFAPEHVVITSLEGGFVRMGHFLVPVLLTALAPCLQEVPLPVPRLLARHFPVSGKTRLLLEDFLQDRVRLDVQFALGDHLPRLWFRPPALRHRMRLQLGRVGVHVIGTEEGEKERHQPRRALLPPGLGVPVSIGPVASVALGRRFQEAEHAPRRVHALEQADVDQFVSRVVKTRNFT